MTYDDAILLRLSIGYTLVDVTKTGVTTGGSKERNQQRNYETLVQVLGLRAQLITLSKPESSMIDLSAMHFGEDFVGSHQVWTFKFGVEQEAVYSNQTSLFGTLENDFVSVPVISGLDETAIIVPTTFIVAGPNRNIYFEQIRI